MTQSTAAKTPSLVIETPEELLAHALTMENEAVECFDEMANNMRVHNNHEVADLFSQFAEFGRKHVAEVHTHSQGRTLPHIAPWDYKWPEGYSPETTTNEDSHYLMTPYHTLKLAHKVESRAKEFYEMVAETSPNSEARELAAEFAKEETEHVELLESWLKRYPKPEADWDYDPDPPRMPE